MLTGSGSTLEDLFGAANMDVALFVKTADAPKTFVLSTTSGGDILQTTATQTAVALV